MAEFWIWPAFALLALAAARFTRMNPSVGYSRTMLLTMVVLSLVLLGAILAFGMFADPIPAPSGVFDD